MRHNRQTEASRTPACILHTVTSNGPALFIDDFPRGTGQGAVDPVNDYVKTSKMTPDWPGSKHSGPKWWWRGEYEWAFPRLIYNSTIAGTQYDYVLTNSYGYAAELKTGTPAPTGIKSVGALGGPAPAYFVSTPSVNQIVKVGEAMTVTWRHNPDSVSGTYSAYLSIDGGRTFAPIPGAQGVAHSNLVTSSYTWTVPASLGGKSTLTADAVVKIQSDGADRFGLSSLFGIVAEGFIPVNDTIDDLDSRVTFTGSGWAQRDLGIPYKGTYSLSPFQTEETHTATFVPNLPHGGVYEVFIHWTDHPNRATNAPVRITHKTGTETKMVDMTQPGGYWMSLGYYEFDAGPTTEVFITTEGTDGGQVVVDGIAFVRRAGYHSVSLHDTPTLHMPGTRSDYLMAVYNLRGQRIATMPASRLNARWAHPNPVSRAMYITRPIRGGDGSRRLLRLH
jgi:hypothetical protein